MTAHGSVESAVEALRAGAADYILKPVVFDDVIAKIGRVLEHRQLAWQTQMLRREVEAPLRLRSPDREERRHAGGFHLVRKVAPTQTTVLITGESGTGKEVVARAIHHYSQASGKVFLPVNCAAIPETLLESQLFGHVRGAFTGAVTAQEGLFARARGGTIFLDEIGDLPTGLQSKLLRAIEAKEILPVGSTHPVTVEVRIITATNRELLIMVEDGTFREDLYYRLNVVEIHLPPLRDRREDIPELIEFLVRRHNREMKRCYRGVDNATLKLLLSQPWKGNVRELDNVIEHAMILGNGEWITMADLPRAAARGRSGAPGVATTFATRSEPTRRSTSRTCCGASATTSVRRPSALGLSLSSLYRKMNELGIPLD